jgi:hypothetical protein
MNMYTYSIILLRAFLIALGCSAVCWGALLFPGFWRESDIGRITDRLVAGDQFKNNTLAQQTPLLREIEGAVVCHPTALRSAAIIRLRMFEMEDTRDVQLHAIHRKELKGSIRKSLSCSPADAFLWLSLYWLESSGEDRGQSELIAYLRQSYSVGPHEGWVAVKRNPLAFAVFKRLPEDLRQAATAEFIDLINSDFIDSAAQTLLGSAWPERELILSELSHLGQTQRRRFAAALAQRGYDLDVPGIGLAPSDSHRFAPPLLVPQ